MASKSRFAIHQTKQVRVGFSTGAFLPIAKKILADLSPKMLKTTSVLEVVWVSDATIRKMNKTYRDKDTKTDILSFAYDIDEKNAETEDQTFGQLIISAPTLRRQAKAHKHSYSKEAEILFVHGLLHVLGYDHESKKDFEKMLRLEQRYLGDKSGLVERSTVE